MKAYLCFCIIGVFAFDENKKLIAYKLFKKNPKEIAKKLNALENKKTVEEEQELLKELDGYEINQEKENPGFRLLRKNFRTFVKNFFKGNINLLINEVTIEKAKLKISELQRRDKLIIQAISALNDLDKILNLVSQRLAEWYGLHYPEAKKENLAEKIIKYGRRENFEDFKWSMGMELDDNDIRVLKTYALHVKKLEGLRREIEEYLESIVQKEMPNTNALLGPSLTAKLLASAGSLEKLAKMPSSSVQLLGAEKALFRFLKSKKKKTRPPKHGLIFLSPYVSSAKKEIRGKIARLLASKLTLAIRYDFYSKEDHGKELREELEKKIKEVKK